MVGRFVGRDPVNQGNMLGGSDQRCSRTSGCGSQNTHQQILPQRLMNPYSFTNNLPTLFVDPRGTACVTVRSAEASFGPIFVTIGGIMMMYEADNPCDRWKRHCQQFGFLVEFGASTPIDFYTTTLRCCNDACCANADETPSGVVDFAAHAVLGIGQNIESYTHISGWTCYSKTLMDGHVDIGIGGGATLSWNFLWINLGCTP